MSTHNPTPARNGSKHGLDLEGIRRRWARGILERVYRAIKDGERRYPALLSDMEWRTWRDSSLRRALRLLAAPDERRPVHLDRFRRVRPCVLRLDRYWEIREQVADLSRPLPDRFRLPAVREAILRFLFPDRDRVRTPPEAVTSNSAFDSALNEAATDVLLGRRDQSSATFIGPDGSDETDVPGTDVESWAAVDRRILAGWNERGPADDVRRDAELLWRSLGRRERKLLPVMREVVWGEPGDLTPEEARTRVGKVNVAETADRLGWSYYKAYRAWQRVQETAQELLESTA